jgi:hypothetical protein
VHVFYSQIDGFLTSQKENLPCFYEVVGPRTISHQVEGLSVSCEEVAKLEAKTNDFDRIKISRKI